MPQGHRLQEYELVRVLGFGGFGMTYLGFDHNLDKAIAIKEYLPSDIATRTADRSVAPQASEFRGDFQWGLERFLDEARTLARFDHRHIIKVHRFFEANGTAYIVMEYAEGETLSVYLERKGTLSEAELKGILYPLLDGLEVVHGADFLHRDIKPGNIVLRDVDDSPVLLDFGAARQAIGAKSRSVTSIVTPGYAPIEQYSSRGYQGAWTDIYALGGVCYRALTGQVPDDATDRVRNDPLVPVSQRCADRASGAFLSAIDMALSVDEGDRPQSISVWREALGADATPQQERRQEEMMRRDTGARSRSPSVQRPPVPARADLVEERDKFVAYLTREPSPDAVDNEGKTDLHHASFMNLPSVATYLLNRGADVHAKCKEYGQDGWTPLHCAVDRNAYAVAEVLLKGGSDANAKSNYGLTPLHWAAFNDASATVEVLLKGGADIHAKDNYGDTPLRIAEKKNAHTTAEVLRRYGSHAAEMVETLPEQASLAKERENEPDSQQERRQEETPRHREQVVQRSPLSEQAGLAEERKKFIAGVGREPSPDAVEDEGATDLHHAARLNLPAVATYLLNNGADIHAKNKYGSTPLHVAAIKDASETAEVLLNRGADVYVQNKYGRTPQGIARTYETAEVLRRYGDHTAATVEALPKQGTGARNNKSSGRRNVGHGHVVAVMGMLVGMTFLIFLLGFLLGHC